MQKKILVINSNAIFEDFNSGLYIYEGTAKLLLDLSKHFEITNFHFKEIKKNNDSINNFNLLDSNVKCEFTKKRKSKILSYLNAYYLGLKLLLKTDFLYLFYPNNFKFLTIFCIIFNIPYGLYVRGEKHFNTKLSKFIFKNASFVNTVSPFFTETISLLNNNVRTIKPMISFSINDTLLEKRYNNNDRFNLLFVGRIEKDKGVFELVEAFKNLCINSNYKSKLTFIGDGNSLSALKSFAHKFNIIQHIDFLGAIFEENELKKNYLKSDILILPTYHEGFPRVLYEAMIFKVPIITTFVGGIPSLMKDKTNCLRIDVKSSTDIFDKLSILMKDYNNAIKLAESANDDIIKYLKINNRSHLDLIIDSIKC